jgi:hypothetical protein
MNMKGYYAIQLDIHSSKGTASNKKGHECKCTRKATPHYIYT